ncbi:unnamed protein product [Bursaphelenchus xylophilus]|nr:unnamed protein product [Bursaphelenchus xylophilus]CAG9083728.1 unnamed protein product [Bursaphelenchus xylophilus]
MAMRTPVRTNSQQVIQKKFSDLTVDVYNISQSYTDLSIEGAENLERFIKSKGEPFMRNNNTLRTVDRLNEINEKLEKILQKITIAIGNLKAMNTLSHQGSVETILETKISSAAHACFSLLRELQRDLEHKRCILQKASLSTDADQTRRMEGIPRVLMLVPDIKLPEGPSYLDQTQKIKNYIAQHYQNNPENFNEAIQELDAMRNCVLLGFDEQRTILVLKRYFAQLMMMKNRFPMELDGEAAIEFSWQDKSSNNLPVVLPDIHFEICCVMFNIGTIHAHIAGAQLRTEEDSIKVSFDHFRAASWPFIYLRDELKASRLGIVDFSTDALIFYANVMLAQAQECLLEKSLINHNSSLVSAKLALRISDIYNSCAHVIQGDASADRELALIKISSSRSKQWLSLCNVKTNLYAAICAFFRGTFYDDKKEFGKGVTCYAYGLEKAKQALAFAEKDKRDGLIQSAVFVLEVLTQKEANSRKENDFIYHERTPTYADLDEFKAPTELVSPNSYDPLDKSLAGEDLFKQLLPSTVITIVSLYEERKAQMKREVQDKVDRKDIELEEFLTTLRLDKLNLDQPYEAYRLPEALLTCCSEMASNPSAVPDLNVKFHEVATRSAEAECKLSELTNRLNAINAKELVETDGFKAIVKKVKSLNEHHLVAKKNNTELQAGFDATTDNLKVLTKPIHELTKMLCDEFFDPVDTPEGKELKRLLDKVDEMQKQRRKLVEDLRDALDRDDITPQALVDPYVQPEIVIEKQIKKHDQKLDLIEKNLSAQSNIIKAVINGNAAFDEVGQKIAKREEKKSTEAAKLLASYQGYKEIVKQTISAIEFYTQLFSMITKLSDSIKNIEEANTRFEKELIDRKKAVEEKERAALAAKQAAEAMADFGFPSISPCVPSNGVTDAKRPGAGRKTLGDYLDHYKNNSRLPPNPTPSWAPPPFSAPVSAPYQPSSVSNNPLPAAARHASPYYPSHPQPQPQVPQSQMNSVISPTPPSMYSQPPVAPNPYDRYPTSQPNQAQHAMYSAAQSMGNRAPATYSTPSSTIQQPAQHNFSYNALPGNMAVNSNSGVYNQLAAHNYIPQPPPVQQQYFPTSPESAQPVPSAYQNMYMTPAVSGNQPIQTVSNGIHQVPNVSYQNPQICASPAAYTQPNPPIQGQETDVLAAVGFSSPGVPSQSTYQTVPAMPPSSGFSSAAKTYQPNTSGYNRPAPGVSPWHQGLATPYNPNQPFPPGPPNNNSLI